MKRSRRASLLLVLSATAVVPPTTHAFCPKRTAREHTNPLDLHNTHQHPVFRHDIHSSNHPLWQSNRNHQKNNNHHRQRNFLNRVHYREATTLEVVQEDEDNENDDPKQLWIRWMMGGKPRGTSRVIHREAQALGGVPRSARYSSRDWFHSLITFPNSNILHDIQGPVRAITLWATAWSLVDHFWTATSHRFYLPSAAPHSLMMSVLGLLLVFRTNSAYQRFAEGRKIWEDIINASRDLYRMMMLYESDIGVDKRRRLQKLLAAFPYLLRHRIRPNLVMRRLDDNQFARDPENTILLYQDQGVHEDDMEAAALAQTEEETGQSRRKTRPLFWVDKRSLPWRLLPQDGALEMCAKAQNRPLWVCDRMAQELRNVPDSPSFTNRERLILISHVDKLSKCIGGSERIHQTVVPLNYARHTLRALTMWLFSLPFVVMKDLKLLTGPVLFIMSWMLFGVFEVSCAIEDPFQGTLRLSILCDTIRRDVLADESIRSTAFRVEGKKPLPLREEKNERDERNGAERTASAGGLDTSFE